MIGRRSVMRLLAGAPFVSKLAGENAALALMQGPAIRATPMGLVEGSALHGGGDPVSARDDAMSVGTKRLVMRAALKIKRVNDEYESITYERYREVIQLDHDLAANKSYSLAAKIVYQRQRNVARAKQGDLADTPWERANVLLRSILSGQAL